jgi:hypothetical protein
MCPGTKNLIKHIEQRMEDDNIENITYRQRMTTDRSTLNFLHHSFITQQQSRFYNELKLKLKTGETAICDFSENYSITQDEVQEFHWNNALATLHPFVAYYSQNEMTEHISFVIIISDCLKHDTVHFIQSKLYSFRPGKLKKYD